MTTPGDIIAQALKKSGVLGVGQTASAEDTNDALVDMNQLISQWNRKRWLIYHLKDVSVVSTGQRSYTIGLGGDFDTERPDRLENGCFLRQITQSQPNQVDYTLNLLESREDYSTIVLKGLQSLTQYVFYDAAYPVGLVYPWPIPQASIYELHLLLKAQLTQFTSLSQVIELPPEYEAALTWNLAERLRPSYQLPVDISVSSFAKDSLNLIRNANAQIPRLKMPGRLVRPGSKYNIFSDQSYN